MGGGVRAFTAGRDVQLPCAVVQPHQTHSTVVVHVDRAGLTREDLEGVDALVTDTPGVAIGVRTADCIPVLMYDPVHRAIGAVHSGWRGTVSMISKKTVMEMCRLFGTCPEEAHLQSSVFKLSKDLIDSIHEEGIVAYTS